MRSLWPLKWSRSYVFGCWCPVIVLVVLPHVTYQSHLHHGCDRTMVADVPNQSSTMVMLFAGHFLGASNGYLPTICIQLYPTIELIMENPNHNSNSFHQQVSVGMVFPFFQMRTDPQFCGFSRDDRKECFCHHRPDIRILIWDFK